MFMGSATTVQVEGRGCQELAWKGSEHVLGSCGMHRVSREPSNSVSTV